jgi:hypothetical protein
MFGWLLILLTLCLPPVFAQEVTIDAQVNKDEVHFGESVVLLLTITQPISGGAGSYMRAPQVSQIPGFDIVSQRSSQNMSIVNGEGQVTVQTQIELVPKGPGDLVIPALNLPLPGGKSASTQAIPIKVLPPEPEKTESEPEKTDVEEPEEKGGISFFKGLLLIGLVLGLVIGVPVLLSQVLTRMQGGNKPSTKWSTPEPPKPVNSFDAAVAATTATSRPSGLPRQASEAAVITEPEPATRIDFEREVTALKRQHPDANRDFYKAYFDLFHRALLGASGRLDRVMTPDELFRQVSRALPPQLAEAIKRVSSDWEHTVYANGKPGRAFGSLHEDAAAILYTLQQQEHYS